MALPAGGTWADTPQVGFFAADTTISSAYLRVKLSGDHTVTVAGLDDIEIGVARAAAAAAADPVSVLTETKQGTMVLVAAGAISQNALVYPAASGKVSATVKGAPRWIALEAAAGDGSVIECMRFNSAVVKNTADPGTGVAITVPPQCSAHIALTIASAGAETNTLLPPIFPGQRLSIMADTVGTGTRAITASQNINQAGNTIMTFAAAADWCVLEGSTVGGTLKWRVLANDGVALS